MTVPGDAAEGEGAATASGAIRSGLQRAQHIITASPIERWSCISSTLKTGPERAPDAGQGDDRQLRRDYCSTTAV